MKPPVLIAALCLVLIALVLAIRPAPRPVAPASPTATASAARAAATGWPLEPDTKWVYSVTPVGGKTLEAVVFATDGRQGVRLVEERDGRSVDVDHIEARDDGWYWAEHDSTVRPWLLIPKDFPARKDWTPLDGVRASVIRQRDVPVGDRTVSAYEIQYEQADPKREGAYSKKMLLVFAPGVGIVGKDSVVDGQPGGERWEIVRFEPAAR